MPTPPRECTHPMSHCSGYTLMLSLIWTNCVCMECKVTVIFTRSVKKQNYAKWSLRHFFILKILCVCPFGYGYLHRQTREKWIPPYVNFLKRNVHLDVPRIPQFLLFRKEPKGCAGTVTVALPEPPGQQWARPSVPPTRRARLFWGPSPSLVGEPHCQAQAGQNMGATSRHIGWGYSTGQTKTRQRKSTHLSGLCPQVLQFSSHYYSDNEYKVRSEYEGTWGPYNSLTATSRPTEHPN